MPISERQLNDVLQRRSTSQQQSGAWIVEDTLVVKLSLVVMFALSLATLSLAASAIPTQSAPLAVELR